MADDQPQDRATPDAPTAGNADMPNTLPPGMSFVSWDAYHFEGASSRTPRSVVSDEDWTMVPHSPNSGKRALAESASQTARSEISSTCSEAQGETEQLADSLLSTPVPELAVEDGSPLGPPLSGGPSQLDEETVSVKMASTLSSEGSLEGFSEGAALQDEVSDVARHTQNFLTGLKTASHNVADLFETMMSKAASLMAQLRGSLASKGNLLKGWIKFNASQVLCQMHKIGYENLAPEAVFAPITKLRAQVASSGVYSPRWLVYGLATTQVLTVAALAALAMKNKKLQLAVRQKDKELAKLVMRVMSLSDALHQHRHWPILRHTNVSFAATHI